MEFKDLPEEIRVFSTSKEVTDSIIEIANIYKVSNKTSEIAKIIGKICLKEIGVSKLQENLRNKLEIQDEATLKNITLDIAEKILLPMRHYLYGIEDLIKSLGGEVPEIKQPITPVSPEKIAAVSQVEETPYAEQIAAQKETITAPAPPLAEPALPSTPASVIKEDIRNLILKNPQIGSQEIGKQDIFTNEDNVKMAPTISNFLADYDYFLGAGWHSNLDRLKYLGQNENARRLSQREKDVLAKILESYDDEKSLPFSLTPVGLLDFENYSGKVFEPEKKAEAKETSAPSPLEPKKEEFLPPSPPKPPLPTESSFPQKKEATPPLPAPPPLPPRPFKPIPKENIINLKEKSNGTIPNSSIYRN